ncbi:MAG TPA: adenylate/guanylate cyclase domain-containing protein [Candidatus Ozemobacteraceae bacterium]|nr:adenylate/guanylate cyclase domain-containing protein [Candidatus Ozemobacteraceae bacterium]
MLAWTAAFFLVAILLPAAGLWHLTDRFEASTSATREAASREKARELVMRLRSSLDRAVVITEKLGRFRRAVIAERRGRPLDGASAGIHGDALRRVFPADTQLHWFDAADRMIAVPGRPLPPGQRAWRAFLRALRDESKLTPAELSLAQGLLKKTFGSIASLKYLRRSRAQSTEVLIGGKLHALAVVTFNTRHAPKRRLGSCIVIAPLYRAKPGWELERAMRLHSGPEAAVGGIWQTTGDGPAAEPLSPGMLHGLWELLERGQAVYATAEWYIYSQVYDKNTDLMLTVAIRTPERSQWVTACTTAVRSGLAAGVLIAGIGLFILGTGWWRPRANLGTKFGIAAAALTLPPLLAMTLLGLEHLNRLSQSRTESLQSELESRLAGIEQKVASELGRLESELLAMTRNPALARVTSGAEYEEMLESFKLAGLSRAVLVFLDGRSYEYHLADQKSSWGILDAIGKRTMQYYGFRPPKLSNERTLPREIEMLFPEQSINDQAHTMFSKLTPIQFANQSTVIFQAFLRETGNRKPVGFFSTHFDHVNLNTKMMERALIEGRSRGGRIAVLGNLPATSFYIGSNIKLRKLLELVRFTGQNIQAVLPIRGHEWLVRARPLKGIDAAGIALVRADTHDPSWPATALFLVLFACGGALASHGATSRLRSLLIEPLATLTAAVKRVEGGDYRSRIVSTADDELGVLIRRLGILVQGLRHKARMTPFLRADLVENAATHTPDPGQRQPLTVLFAGLRNFSGVEALLPPEEAMNLMSRYLGLCEAAVKRHGGDIDKFIGDTAMAIFRERPETPPAALRAIRAALEIDRAMNLWKEEGPDGPGRHLRHGVGFASGTPVSGHIGSLRKRLDATVIGDTVNLAARLEKLAGRDGTPSILTTSQTITGLSGGFVSISTSISGVRGRKEAIEIVGVGGTDHG